MLFGVIWILSGTKVMNKINNCCPFTTNETYICDVFNEYNVNSAM